MVTKKRKSEIDYLKEKKVICERDSKALR